MNISHTNQLEQQIEKTKTEIQNLKEELVRERLIRKNKEEYDLLAATIQQYPSRDQTAK